MTFQNISLEEETILKRAFNNWSIFHVFDNNQIIVKEIVKIDKEKRKITDIKNIGYSKNKKFKEVYICSNIKQKEQTIQLQPIISGINIGIIRDKKFIPNLNFGELVIRSNKKLDYPYAMVNDKATNLFLYGRDIYGDSIISFFKEIKENQILVIIDKNKEPIGLGRSRFNGSLIIQNNKITIDNIQNIGTFYLKEENNCNIIINH